MANPYSPLVPELLALAATRPRVLQPLRDYLAAEATPLPPTAPPLAVLRAVLDVSARTAQYYAAGRPLPTASARLLLLLLDAGQIGDAWVAEWGRQ